ncbi:MAG TPA: aminotransferase class V-fold PLP-dependent enzyme [Solirubrobacteraceae bacterium]|nr:aminotransferase class V-fold PLP-dependent enzyme [Solirubrobacteraceae bacterium]
MDATRLRAEFPVLSRLAYLNAGTDGPLPERAVRAAAEELERELRDGRAKAHFERRGELSSALRAAYSRALGCDAADVALTTSATEGIGQVVSGIPLQRGDEIVTSDEEHPGLQGALAAAREVRGAVIREVPFAEVAGAVGPRTRLVACSHVSWMTGALAPAELARLEVPVLLDGAQGMGAVPTDVHAIGCSAYAAAGQKWACGPDGSGALFVSAELRERLAVERRGYGNLADAGEGLSAKLHADARRFDSASLSAEANACALAAITLLEDYGWAAIHERAAALAELFAERLAERGREPAPRDRTTLVSFESPDAETERAQLAEAGVVVRNIPGRPWLRASVGAWNDEQDLERLLAALSP